MPQILPCAPASLWQDVDASNDDSASALSKWSSRWKVRMEKSNACSLTLLVPILSLHACVLDTIDALINVSPADAQNDTHSNACK